MSRRSSPTRRRPRRRCARSSPPSDRRSRSSGPRPPRTRPPEAPAIAAERARLTALAAGLDGAIKSTELTWVRARQLIEKITVLRHSLFTKNLMERLPSPLLPELWRDLDEQVPGRRPPHQLSGGGLAALGQHQAAAGLGCCSRPRSFSSSSSSTPSPGSPIGAGCAASRRCRPSSSGPGRWPGSPRCARCRPSPPPRSSMADSTPWTCCSRPGARAAAAVLKAIVLYSAVSALIFAVLAPRAPQWRLVCARRRADAPRRAGCSAPSPPSTPSTPR